MTYILERYDDAVGIIAAGSILRGQGHATSDLDLYVIRTRPQRQRVQRRFQGVAAEIFVNPPRQIARYFADEARDSRPITAHMLAHGAVVLALDPVVEQLRAQAEAELQRAPGPRDADLRWERYLAALELEDALDILDQNPPGGTLILCGAVHKMLRYAFRQARRPLPRDKDLLTALETLDPALAGGRAASIASAIPARSAPWRSRSPTARSACAGSSSGSPILKTCERRPRRSLFATRS